MRWAIPGLSTDQSPTILTKVFQNRNYQNQMFILCKDLLPLSISDSTMLTSTGVIPTTQVCMTAMLILLTLVINYQDGEVSTKMLFTHWPVYIWSQMDPRRKPW